MTHQTIKRHRSRIRFDSALISEQPEQLFLRVQDQELQRGSALFFEHDGEPLAFKRYHRGGLLGRLITYQYFAPPRRPPRMFREYDLLVRLRERGLPVPRPVAARCCQTSLISYRGELVTRRITPAETLTTLIQKAPLGERLWAAIGKTLADFHAQFVYHADLNASNILIDGREDSPVPVHLIDFDKGEIRDPNGTKRAARTETDWKRANLQRLRRSLDKVQAADPALHFSERDWQTLLTHYE